MRYETYEYVGTHNTSENKTCKYNSQVLEPRELQFTDLFSNTRYRNKYLCQNGDFCL